MDCDAQSMRDEITQCASRLTPYCLLEITLLSISAPTRLVGEPEDPQRVDVPVFLAGGLRAENVGAAIEQVQPFGVDLCSGIRSPDGKLDEAKRCRFMRAAHRPLASTE